MAQRNIDRVESHTPAPSNEEIQRQMLARLQYFANRPDEIPGRLRELEKEWDMERVLEATSAALSLTGLLLALFRKRVWMFVPLAVQSFFMQHAIQGWCPPVPLFRKLGVRTMREILEERAELIQMLAQYRGRPQPTAPIQGGPPMGLSMDGPAMDGPGAFGGPMAPGMPAGFRG